MIIFTTTQDDSPFKTVTHTLSHTKYSLDCKTIGFFLKISKEIGKAWRKSKSEAREPHTSVGRVRREKTPVSLFNLALCFQPRSRPFV